MPLGSPPATPSISDKRFKWIRPEASGFAGQLLGRTVVALVGSEGLSENDPLVKLDRMNTLLLEWG